MTDHFVLLPYPPSWNRLYRIARGRMYKHRDYVNWLRTAESELVIQLGLPLPLYESPISVKVLVGRPDNRQRDLDNVLKALGDLLEDTGIVENDHLIHHWDVRWDALTHSALAVTIKDCS